MSDTIPQDHDTQDLDVLRAKAEDAYTPGFAVELDPDEAERAGAFTEDALSEQDAADSTEELANGTEAPYFIGDEVNTLEPPDRILTADDLRATEPFRAHLKGRDVITGE